jgi:hypothetical protein
MNSAARQNGKSRLPRLKKQMIIDAIQAHFFAFLNCLPAIKQTAETTKEARQSVIFSDSVLISL